MSLTTEYSVLPLQKLQPQGRIEVLTCSKQGFSIHFRCAFSPCDDGQMWRSHAGSHEEDHVLMPGLPVVHHFLFEELQVVLIVPVDLEQTDGDLAVPPTLVHPTPAALEPAKTLRAPLRRRTHTLGQIFLTFPMSSPRSSCSKGMSHSCRYTLVWLGLREMGPFH